MLSASAPLLLASASPRRRDLLGSFDVPLAVQGVDVDERVLAGETPEDYVLRVTRLKLNEGRRLRQTLSPVPAAVLVADTTVALDGRIFGKPRDQEEAREMIGALSGRTHRVLTAYGISSEQEEGLVRCVATQVTLRPASDDELDAYALTLEGLDKAGAYGIQGRASFLVESITGSYSAVVGLPVCEVLLDLKHLGLWDVTRSSA
jgi:septum formation protein